MSYHYTGSRSMLSDTEVAGVIGVANQEADSVPAIDDDLADCHALIDQDPTTQLLRDLATKRSELESVAVSYQNTGARGINASGTKTASGIGVLNQQGAIVPTIYDGPADVTADQDPTTQLLQDLATKRSELESAALSFQHGGTTDSDTEVTVNIGVGKPKRTSVLRYITDTKQAASSDGTSVAQPKSSGKYGEPIVPATDDNNGNVLDQPVLRRGTGTARESLPGAFRGSKRADNLDYSLLGTNESVTMVDTNESPTLVGNHESANPTAANSDLVEARQVHQEDPEANILTQAAPFDPEEARQRKEKWIRSWQLYIALFAFVVIVAAIVVGAVVGSQKNENEESGSKSIDPAATVYNSSMPEPSGVPSAAPTAILDELISGLPESTRASLFNSSAVTPQWRALQWLENHQNITGLPEWRKRQLFALSTFFYAFGGGSWYGPIQERWLDDEKDECRWFSSGYGAFSVIDGEYSEWEADDIVNSCNEKGEFISLFLQDLNLTEVDTDPSIPPEIALLTSLEQINLSFNSINASLSAFLPKEVFQITSLTLLDVDYNDFKGTIPTSFGSLSQLVSLKLGRNQEIDGPIPSELGLLSSLSVLWLQGSKLSGSIPSQLGLLRNLEQFYLFRNSVTGTVPTELGMMTRMLDIDMEANQLSGNLPTELGLMGNLTTMWVSDNSLSGQVPTQLWSTNSLEELHLFGNSFSGSLPSEMGLLSSFRILNLADNLVVGTLPSEVGLVTSLEKLHLQNNSLTGMLPSQLSADISLRLDGNQFSGAVPEPLCSFLWCEDCPSNVSLASTCWDLSQGPVWPGRLPPVASDGEDATIMLNFQTDSYPEESSWAWQQESRNQTNIWESLVDSGGALEQIDFLHSYILPVSMNSTHRLLLSDSYGDGTLGWATLRAANGTVLYSMMDVMYFSEIEVLVRVQADQSFHIESTLTA